MQDRDLPFQRKQPVAKKIKPKATSSLKSDLSFTFTVEKPRKRTK